MSCDGCSLPYSRCQCLAVITRSELAALKTERDAALARAAELEDTCGLEVTKNSQLRLDLRAALARAEAAEREQRTWFAHAQESLQSKLAAESRLAEATALLEAWLDAWRRDDTCVPKGDTESFLSATPAPAARCEVRHALMPSVRCNSPAGHDGSHIDVDGDLIPAPAAESEPDRESDRPSFPSTILKAREFQKRAIKAEARIAELEREREQDRSAYADCREREWALERELAAAREHGQAMRDALKAAEVLSERRLTAIDAAVVELERGNGPDSWSGALSLLRAAQKAAT